MNVLIEIAHPAHVHFFRRAIEVLISQGNSVSVITRNKEITNNLLDRFEIPYKCLSMPAKTKIGLLFELIIRWFRIFFIIKKNRIHVAASISGISTSLPAWICRVRNVVFTDTEDARLSNKLAFPFTNTICTPSFYLDDLGKRHRRYNGLHELAYISKFDYSVAPKICRTLGLPDRYCIIRLVAYDAVHDWGINGIGELQLEKLIQKLSVLGKVFITSQNPLPESLSRYALKIPIDKVHVVLARARIFVGESPTMAVEAALLGTPSFLVGSRVKDLGNMIHLEKDWNILKNFLNWDDFFGFMEKNSFDDEIKDSWQKRSQDFIDSMDDVNEVIIKNIMDKQ